MRVLLVEPDETIRASLAQSLATESFQVFTTDSGDEAVDLGKLYDYDIILLELDLPDMSGLEVIRTLRVAKVQTPIMFLTHTKVLDLRLKALGYGADGYLTKPFHRDELVANMHAIVRRVRGHSESQIVVGPLMLDIDSQTAEIRGNRLHLTGKEYQMLEAMALRKGMTLTKDAFLNHLYGGMDEPELKIIDVFICKLRKKLAAAGAGDLIETIWGRGYVLREPTHTAQEAVAA